MNTFILKLNLTRITFINPPNRKSKKCRLVNIFEEKKLRKIKLSRFAEFITKSLIRRNLKGAKRRIIRRN